MGTVTYKKQNSAAKDLKAGVPLAGGRHVYTVNKILWPEEVSDFIQTLLVGKTLHVCCGKSMLGDTRLDLYEETADIKADAAAIPADDESFDTALCDPPYTGKMQWNHDLLKELSRVAKTRIIFQHWFIPADPDGLWKKWKDKFQLTAVYVWQPRTYFGRVQVISVFDRRPTPHDEEAKG